MGLSVFDVRPLMKLVGEQFGARTFVEGGTFTGATARWASEHFEKVITIEAYQPLYEAARKSLADRPNVSCLFGDTLAALHDVLAKLGGPAAVLAAAVRGGTPQARAAVAGHRQHAATLSAPRTPWRRVRDTMTQLRADVRHWLTCRQRYDSEGRPL